jgi:hypothetical protein
VAVASAVAPYFEQGTRIIPFVRPWSTMDKIESKPRTGGNLVTKSMERWAKGQVEVGPGIGIKAGHVG